MHINTPRESDISYNATSGLFEARVTLRDGSGVYTYAVETEAPLQAEWAVIARSMVVAARRMHIAPGKGLHLRSKPADLSRLAA